jgi:hypothetical protein
MASKQQPEAALKTVFSAYFGANRERSTELGPPYALTRPIAGTVFLTESLRKKGISHGFHH